MRYSFVLILLIFSFFPACKRNNEHTQSCARVTQSQKEQAKTFPDNSCDLVDRSNLGKGIACLVAAPAVGGVGTILSCVTAFVCGGIGCCGYSLAACLPAIGIFAGTLIGTGFIFYKGCSYLSQHARSVKERERRRKEEREKICEEQLLAANGVSL